MKRLLLLVAVVPLVIATPAFAYIVAPTSITISHVDVFRNLAEDEDMLVIFRYSMPYTSDNYSSTPASESIMLRLYDSDNVTELQTSAPYVYPLFGSNGYGEGTGSFYLTPTEASGLWGDALIINIVGQPGFFSPAISQSYILTPSDYTSATTQDANRQLLKDYILLDCDRLTSAYSVTGVILKASSDSGVVLSAYGENYYMGVVDGLPALCPSLFFIQSLIPETMEVVPYDMSLGETYAGRLATDDLGKGFSRLGDLLGIGGAAAAAVLTFLATIALCIWTTRKQWGTEIGMMGGALVGVLMMLLVGDVVFTVMMILSLIAAIGITWIFILKKA